MKEKDAERLEKYSEELEDEHSKLAISVDEALKGHLKSYHGSRIAFERKFESGGKFKYGALNIGGIGVERYGGCCVVFKRERVEEYSSLAFIKEDSLEYIDDKHEVDIEGLGEDVANRECIHLMATLKHERDIESTTACDWPSMVCCSEDYIDTIITDDILSAHIHTVRMSREHFNSHFDSLYKHFTAELSGDSGKYRLGVFRNMLELLDKQRITLEVLSEDGD